MTDFSLSSLPLAMEVDPQHGFSSSLTIPLVLGSHGSYHSNNQSTKTAADTSADELVALASFHYEEGKSTFFKTCFNGINALSGVGILSVPYALASGGWLSLILLFIIAASTFLTGLLMRRCMNVNSLIRTYPDIGEHAFGHKGRAIVSIFMYLELYLVATGFLILEGDNLHNLFPNMVFELAGIKLSGQGGFVILVSLIILPTVLLKDLSMLSYVSASGVLASLIIVGSVIWVGAVDGVGFHEKGTLLKANGLPTSVSLYAFCYCAHPVFPTLYTSMKDKRQFPKVLLVCFVICTIAYASVAISGYLMYGENVQSQVTLNLPTQKLSSKIAIYTTLVNPLTKYALMMTPIVSAIENHLPHYYNNKTIISLLIRITLLISTVIVALAVPFFGLLMSFAGAFLSATSSIILPCVCYVKITGAYQRWSYEMVIILGILLMGTAVVVIGTIKSLGQIAGIVLFITMAHGPMVLCLGCRGRGSWVCLDIVLFIILLLIMKKFG